MQKSSTCEQPHEDPNIRYLGMNRPRPGRFLTTKDDGPANYELRLGVMSKTLEIPSSTTGVIDIDVVVNGDRRESPRRDCHTLVTAVTPESPEEVTTHGRQILAPNKQCTKQKIPNRIRINHISYRTQHI